MLYKLNRLYIKLRDWLYNGTEKEALRDEIFLLKYELKRAKAIIKEQEREIQKLKAKWRDG